MSEDGLEEASDEVIAYLRESIDTESQFIKEQHKLYDKIRAVETIFIYLEDNIPQDKDHVHDLNHIASQGLMDIKEHVKDNNLANMEFIKEEKHNLEQLELDKKQKKYQAMKTDLSLDSNTINKQEKIEKEQLKELHHKIISLMKEIKKSKMISAINEDFSEKKEKKEYLKKEEYYFVSVYKFLRAYERIFRHLWKKEHFLAKQLAKKIKK